MQSGNGFKKNLVFFAILLVCIGQPAFAATIYVDANGTGDYPTIQAAIDDANNGDKIVLADGTYTGKDKSRQSQLSSPPTLHILDDFFTIF